MHKSSLLEIIRTFTPKELVKFEDFVNSPYFNKNKNAINLFNEVKKYAPEFIHENLEKEIVWKKLFQDKEYNYGIMKNIIHDLSKLCDSFLAEEIYAKNDHQRNADILQSVFDRSLERLFGNKYEMTVKQLKNDFKDKKFESSSDYFNKMNKISELYELFLHSYKPQLKNKIDVKPECEYLIYEFFIKAFYLYQKITGHSFHYNHPVGENLLHIFLKSLEECEDKIIEKVIELSKNNSTDYYLILNCYYSLYKALKYNDNYKYCLEFKKNISLIRDKISLVEYRNLNYANMTAMTNLTITLVNFSQEYFEILMNVYNTGLFHNEDESINPHFFGNMVNLSCSVKEYEFAEKFIVQYSPKLPADFRESVYNYSMSVLCFCKKEFNASLEYLSKIQNEFKSMKMNVKNLQLNIYYELNDRESFEYAYDSLKHYLGKNKMTNESRILVLTKYCGYVRSLFKIREKFNSYEFDSLKKEITENKTLSKGWLLRKLDEIESENKKNR